MQNLCAVHVTAGKHTVYHALVMCSVTCSDKEVTVCLLLTSTCAVERTVHESTASTVAVASTEVLVPLETRIARCMHCSVQQYTVAHTQNHYALRLLTTSARMRL
jgi:hypothetical protein